MGCLQQIPSDLLTEANLSIKDNDGHSSFHLAVLSSERLGSIPKDLLTSANLTIRDDKGATPLHPADDTES
jgi:ankyrin repeat protein